jgi:uncharacterized protein (DUF433 family)
MDAMITSDPAIVMDKPVIKGTRITVEHILEELAGGRTIDELLDAYPPLSREGVEAALRFAVEAVRHESVHPLPNP